MTYTVKILIPVGLGVMAAILNLMVLRGATQPVSFVKVTQDVTSGEPFTSDALEKLDLPSQFRHLQETAVPFENIGELIGQPAQRDLVAGDIVFLRDIAPQGDRIDLRDGETAFPLLLRDISVAGAILQIGNELEFRVDPDPANAENEPQWIGPFRLLSVGDRVANDEGADTPSGASIISVAFDLEPKEVTREEHQKLLEKAADQSRTEDRMLLNIRLYNAR